MTTPGTGFAPLSQLSATARAPRKPRVRTREIVLVLITTTLTAQAVAQNALPDPQIGYVFPAGAKRGTTVQVVVGGQFLRGASEAYISGDGIHARVIKEFPPLRNLEREQRESLARRVRALIVQRWDELVKNGAVQGNPPWAALRAMGIRVGRANTKQARKPETETVPLPEHPYLRNLEDKSLREILHSIHNLRSELTGQRNRQLAATVLVEVRVDRDAQPGNRELRLNTRLGLTNPLCFQVGVLPEYQETELGDARIVEFLPPEPALETPVLINGQILPGDVDQFRFLATQGQQLVIEACARQLIPYLADAVPGWFQATITLYDQSGDELAFVDDYRFSPDPVLYYEIPTDGTYTLEIRDAIYRGRQDFVYRVSVGQRPFITSIFPLGCRAGQKRYVSVTGWNLHTDRLCIDGKSRPAGVWETPLGRGANTSNIVAYQVDRLIALVEVEPNNSLEDAQPVPLPRIVDGRIDQPGDIDLFQFTGRGGQEVVLEAIARRVRSPLDSIVRLFDESGAVLAWNDDYQHKQGHLHTEMGTITHHADSYLRATLPADGTYYAQIVDAQMNSGEPYAYRLRIAPPTPDFELRITPPSINLRAGLAAPIRVYALRKDGFSGPIDLDLRNAPPGFELAGARIPAGRDDVRLTLTAAGSPDNQPLDLTFQGHSEINGHRVTHTAIPAQDLMQAFLYRHLTPADSLLVTVNGGRRARRARQTVSIDGPVPVRIPLGGNAEVRVQIPPGPRARRYTLELSEPPPGITLRNVRHSRGAISFQLVADLSAAQPGLQDNLIVEAYTQIRNRRQPNGNNNRRVAVGVLPAIPIEILPQ